MYVHALHLFQRALAPFDDYLLPFVSMILYWTPGIGKSDGLSAPSFSYLGHFDIDDYFDDYLLPCVWQSKGILYSTQIWKIYRRFC